MLLPVISRPLVLRTAIVGVLLGCVLLASGCGEGEESRELGSSQAAEWVVVRELGPRVAKLAARVEQCEGDPYPTLEEPVVEYSGKKAFIELRLAPVTEPDGDCRRLTVGVQTSVSLKRDLNELVLYDSSTDPPERRWPE